MLSNCGNKIILENNSVLNNARLMFIPHKGCEHFDSCYTVGLLGGDKQYGHFDWQNKNIDL